MPPAGFEPTIPASERSQTHALDCAVTGIGLTDKIDTTNEQRLLNLGATVTL
jgi:hypothetical protein